MTDNLFDLLGKGLFYSIYKDLVSNIDFLEANSKDEHSRRLDSITAKCFRNINTATIKSVVKYLHIASKCYRQWLQDSLEEIKKLKKELHDLQINYERRGAVLSGYITRADEEIAYSQMCKEEQDRYWKHCKEQAHKMVVLGLERSREHEG